MLTASPTAQRLFDLVRGAVSLMPTPLYPTLPVLTASPTAQRLFDLVRAALPRAHRCLL